MQQTTCDLIVRSRITIRRPARDVWRHLLAMDTYMSGLSFETVRGRQGEEGHVQLVRPHDPSPYGSYFVTTVRATPHEQLVLKVSPEKGTDYSGFADFSLFEVGGATEIVYDIYLELRFDREDLRLSHSFRDEQHAAVLQEVDRNHQNLKRLMEEEQDVLRTKT